ncbi:MAG: AAA family ATPase [Lachnospiraceae bacterium]|nr:AAA family ATPase [Lachnospiraceae bacterium]
MSINNIENILWTEKYRPSTLTQLIVPQRIRTIFEKGVVQSMMFYGTAGIGKTSAAKALCKEFGHNTLYLNMSETTGVDTIRETIMEFALNQSILHYDNPIKVVILDEADGMSQQAFAALRATMEKCATNTRFIATLNYLQKVPEPIQSRFQLIDFNFTSEEMKEIRMGQYKRIMEICKKEGLNIEKTAAIKMVQTYFPDCRSIVNHLQRYKLEGKIHITDDDVKSIESEYEELYDMILLTNDPIKNYEFIMKNYSNCVSEVISSLGNPFITYLLKKQSPAVKHIPTIAILNAKYQMNLKNCIDPVVVLLAHIFELQQEMQK